MQLDWKLVSENRDSSDADITLSPPPPPSHPVAGCFPCVLVSLLDDPTSYCRKSQSVSRGAIGSNIHFRSPSFFDLVWARLGFLSFTLSSLFTKICVKSSLVAVNRCSSNGATESRGSVSRESVSSTISPAFSPAGLRTPRPPSICVQQRRVKTVVLC